MSEKTKFEAMLDMVSEMVFYTQDAYFTVEGLYEHIYSSSYDRTSHIVVPNGKGSVIDICFVVNKRDNSNHLVDIQQRNMELMDALVWYSKQALAGQGTKVTFYGC